MEIIPHSADEIRQAIELSLQNKFVTFTILFKNIQLKSADIKSFRFPCSVIFTNPTITATAFSINKNIDDDETNLIKVNARNVAQTADGKIVFQVAYTNVIDFGTDETNMIVTVTIGDTENSATVDFAEEQIVNGGST